MNEEIKQQELPQPPDDYFDPGVEELPAPHPVRVTRSATFGKLAAALAKAQMEFEPIKKDLENPYYKSKYADLANVISATQPALAKNGLVVIQLPNVSIEARQMTLTTLLLHSSDEWLSNELTLPAIMDGRDGKQRFDSQSVGAAMTYARRYAYQAIVGVAAECDDDGNLARGGGTKQAAQDVANKKLADAAVKVKAGASLFCAWDDAEQKGYITGDKDLMSLNRELLLYKGKWNQKEGAVIVDADGLEALKFEFGERKVPFKVLLKPKAS